MNVGYGCNMDGSGSKSKPLCVVRIMDCRGDIIRHAYPMNAASLVSVVKTSLAMGLRVECVRRD